MAEITAQTITRNLWHVFRGETQIGEIKRVCDVKETFYFARRAGDPVDTWFKRDSFEAAARLLAEREAPAPESATAEAPSAESSEAPEETDDRFSHLDLD